MKSRSKTATQRLLKLLQDDTRLAIYVHLMVFKKMTLKQLSEYLGKGKTTIHHHVKKFEKENILIWEEKEEDKKKLKTRHYTFSDSLTVDMDDKKFKQDQMELNVIVSNYLAQIMIEYSKKQSGIVFDELKNPPLVSIPLSVEGLKIYNEFLSKLTELNNEEKSEGGDAQSIKLYGSFLLLPIHDIFEWKLKQNIAED